jgi:hypothetical protein
MDKKNLKAFREYIEQGGEMPVGELGELQNVVSLLPIILELEKPSPALKDKVAKKLISLQEEIKEKIKTTKQSTRSTAKTIIRNDEPEEESEELNITSPTKSTSFETIQPPSSRSTKTRPHTRGTDFYESAQHVNPPPPTKAYDLPPRTLRDLENGDIASSSSIKYLWAGIVFVFLLLFAGLILLYSSTGEYETKITALEQRINSLQEEVISTREFVNRYDELIEFMTYQDIQIVALSPVDESTSGSGKLMISFLHREALLELKEMPTLGTNQAFQIWLISNGRSYSIGSFVPSGTQRYIPITDIPYLPKNQIDLVRVTIEPLTGSELPQGPAVLFGNVGNGTTGR